MKIIREQHGITLIEILVTVIIIAIGFLGLLGTQLISAKNIYGSGYRSLATIYASEVADQLRAANTQINSDVFNPNTTEECSSNCEINELIESQISAWQNKIASPTRAGGLPNGMGSVEFNPLDNNYIVVIVWDEQLNPSAEVEQQQFEMVVQL